MVRNVIGGDACRIRFDNDLDIRTKTPNLSFMSSDDFAMERKIVEDMTWTRHASPTER